MSNSNNIKQTEQSDDIYDKDQITTALITIFDALKDVIINYYGEENEHYIYAKLICLAHDNMLEYIKSENPNLIPKMISD